MITLKDLQDKVEKKISDYIEFDVKKLFTVSDYITIYGGAIRDSLAGLEIHDIDILCMPDSANKLRGFLKEEYGYESLDLFDQDALNMYKGISLIAEPWTLMNKNKKIIQIIRPRWQSQLNKPNDDYSKRGYQESYQNLIKNVDLSCCGVFLENRFSNEIRIGEACKDAIVHCVSRTYIVNKWAKLYNTDRTLYREHKLTLRGWSGLDLHSDYWHSIETKRKFLKRERLSKIFTLEFKPEYDYKIWTEDEYSRHPKENSSDFPF